MTSSGWREAGAGLRARLPLVGLNGRFDRLTAFRLMVWFITDHDPGRGMIACTFKSSNLTVDASFNQAPGCCRVKQQMIDAKACVAWPSAYQDVSCGSRRPNRTRAVAQTKPEVPAAPARSLRRTWRDRCRHRSA